MKLSHIINTRYSFNNNKNTVYLTKKKAQGKTKRFFFFYYKRLNLNSKRKFLLKKRKDKENQKVFYFSLKDEISHVINSKRKYFPIHLCSSLLHDNNIWHLILPFHTLITHVRKPYQSTQKHLQFPYIHNIIPLGKLKGGGIGGYLASFR